MIRRRELLAVTTVAMVGGCGPPDPAVVNLTVKAGSDVNRSRAVAVRLYSLNARGRFTTADAYALLDRERSVLGDEGSRVEEFVVRPGETRNITISPKSDVRFIGVAVLFQDIDRSRWRAVAPVATTGVTKLVLAIGGNTATLEAV